MGAVGWVGMRLADGTTVCRRATKKSFQARRSSPDVRGAISAVMLELDGGATLVGCARAQLGPQLGLAGVHGAAALGYRAANIAAPAADRPGDVGLDLLRCVAAGRPQHPAPDPHRATEARGRPGREPHESADEEHQRSSRMPLSEASRRPRSRRAALAVPLAKATPLMTGLAM